MKIFVYFLSLAVTLICIALVTEFGLKQGLPDRYRGYLVEGDEGTVKWAIGPFEPSQPALDFNAPVSLEKPADTLRIVSLGASGTEGWLSAKTVFAKYGLRAEPKHLSSYSRVLEFSLNRISGATSKKVEVINLGIAAYNITDVVRMLKDAIQLEPDLFLIQIGGNETWTAERSQWSALIDDDIPYLHSALGNEILSDTQAGWETLSTGGNAFNPMALFNTARPQPVVVEPAGRAEGLEQRLANYRRGLGRLGDYLESRKVPVLFMLPAQNLSGYLPFGSMAKPGTSKEQLAELNRLLIAALAEPGPGSKKKFEELLKIDDSLAEANFQLGTIYLTEGDVDRAREHFWRANDRDLVLKRLPSAFHDISRDFLKRYGFPHLDAMEFLESQSVSGVVGFDLLDDDVHPHRRAQFDIGIEIAKKIVDSDLLPSGEFSASLEELPSFRDYNESTGFDEQSEAVSYYVRAAHNYLTFGRYRQRLKWDPNPRQVLEPIVDDLNYANKYEINDRSLYLGTVVNTYLGRLEKAAQYIERLDCRSSAERGANVNSGVIGASVLMFGLPNRTVNGQLREMLALQGCDR